MSRINEQVRRLREYAATPSFVRVSEIRKICSEAADTIETLSEKVQNEDMHGGWIPVEWHYITEEEREENGYPKDWDIHLDCLMPSDEQEILVQTKRGLIRWDVCYEDDGFSLDSGWDWADDIIAWMPLPDPYREGGSE